MLEAVDKDFLGKVHCLMVGSKLSKQGVKSSCEAELDTLLIYNLS